MSPSQQSLFSSLRKVFEPQPSEARRSSSILYPNRCLAGMVGTAVFVSSVLSGCGEYPSATEIAEESVAGAAVPAVPAVPAAPDAGVGGMVVLEITGNDLMQYSVKELKAPAGSKVKLVLKHIGVAPIEAMGHNFVLLKSGSKVSEFGLLCATSTIEQNYLPTDENKDLVIAATKMIGGGQQAEIVFTAPPPGDYPYLCSFPGHFALMNGIFKSEGATAIAAAPPVTPPAAASGGEALNASEQKGKKLFTSTALCFTCHTIGGGRLVGPDLANVHHRHENDWLLRYIKSSQTMVKSGDPAAVKIFTEYAKIPMPDPPGVSEADIQSIIDYITAASSGAGGAAQAAVAGPAVDGDSSLGEKLFVGLTRLENKGPSCNSCHHVRDDKVMAGGSLAKELTQEFSTLGGNAGGAAAINAFLTGTPFPAMREAYGERPLTAEEIAHLTAYLEQVDQQHEKQQEKNYAQTLLYSGVLGALVLMGVFPALWRKRKRGSVNSKIYERQIESAN